jgi:hypothetical protein
MPFSSTSVEPHLQPFIERAFEAAWRELQLTPGRVLSPHQKSNRAELSRRIKAAATKADRKGRLRANGPARLPVPGR